MHSDGWSRVKKAAPFQIAPWLSWLERLLDMEKVTGSNPVGATIYPPVLQLADRHAWGAWPCEFESHQEDHFVGRGSGEKPDE